MPTDTQDHARQNARAWAGSIAEMIAALNCDYSRLEELRDERADLAADSECAAPDNELERKALDAWDEENSEELHELAEASKIDGNVCDGSDDAHERIQESPLSVQVHSGWTSPGEQMEPKEFEILLSTGGPALRIRGELDEYKQPHRAWLEYQDWGTPWTEYYGEGCEQDTLLTFCQQFFFGE